MTKKLTSTRKEQDMNLDILGLIGEAWRQIDNTYGYQRDSMPSYGAENETRKKADKWNMVEYIKKEERLDPDTMETREVTILEQFRGTYQEPETLTVWNFVDQGTTHPHQNKPISHSETVILTELCAQSNSGFMAIQPKVDDNQPWHLDPEKIAETLNLSIGLGVRLTNIFRELRLNGTSVRRIIHGSVTPDGKRKHGLKLFDGSTPDGFFKITQIIDILECIAKDQTDLTTVDPEDAMEHRTVLDEETNTEIDFHGHNIESFQMHRLSDKRDCVSHKYLSGIENADWDKIRKIQKEMFWKYRTMLPKQKSQVWETINYRKAELTRLGQ